MTLSLEMTDCEPPFQTSVWLNLNGDGNNAPTFLSDTGASLTIVADKPMKLSLSARKAIVKVRSFSLLMPDWDRNGADRIDPNAIDEADMFLRMMDRMKLPVYFVSPTRDGGIMVEFDNRSGKAAEVFIGQSGAKDMLLVNGDDMAELAYNESDLINHFK